MHANAHKLQKSTNIPKLKHTSSLRTLQTDSYKYFNQIYFKDQLGIIFLKALWFVD